MKFRMTPKGHLEARFQIHATVHVHTCAKSQNNSVPLPWQILLFGQTRIDMDANDLGLPLIAAFFDYISEVSC